MFKYKLLKIVIASLSLLSFLVSLFSDYIKDKTLERRSIHNELWRLVRETR